MVKRQSAESVAQGQRGEDEGLSSEERAVRMRGRAYRRRLLAAAALHDIYTVNELAAAIEVSPGTVQGWWRGAQPQAVTIPKIARALGFTTEALFAWFYEGASPPRLSDPESERSEGEARGARAAQALQSDADTGSRAMPPAPHETTGSGR